MADSTTPVTQFTASHFVQILGISAAAAATWVDPINAGCAKFNINTPLRMAAFIAQVGVESANLTAVSENLNYSASRLVTVFPSYFNATTAAQYAGNPQMIGSRVYASRYGNKNESSGDGYKFRGRGLMQITFQANYLACARGMGVDCLSNPDLLTQPQYSALSACWFWDNKGLNSYADRKLFDNITKIINGGTNGAATRTALYNKAITVLTGAQDPTAVDADNTNDISTQPTPVANKQAFSEPPSKAAPQYPYNNVYQSRSGHLFEYDDTPGAERIQLYHRAGSYFEMGPLGDIVMKSVLDYYSISQQDFYQYAGGDFTASYIGQAFTKVGGDFVLKSGGQIYLEAANRVQVNTPILAASQQITAPNADLDQITGTYADTLCREAELAHDIGYSDGSGGGPVLNQSLQFDSGGNPQFIKPVSYVQPTTLASAPAADLPAAASFPGAIMQQVNTDGTIVPIFSNGTTWVPMSAAATTTTSTGTGQTGQGGGS